MTSATRQEISELSRRLNDAMEMLEQASGRFAERGRAGVLDREVLEFNRLYVRVTAWEEQVSYLKRRLRVAVGEPERQCRFKVEEAYRGETEKVTWAEGHFLDDNFGQGMLGMVSQPLPSDEGFVQFRVKAIRHVYLVEPPWTSPYELGFDGKEAELRQLLPANRILLLVEDEKTPEWTPPLPEIEKDSKITERRCPACGLPFPTYRKRCKYCDYAEPTSDRR